MYVNIFEIISGVVLLLISLFIIFLVVIQEPKNANNSVSGVIQGGQSYYSQGKVKTPAGILKKLTIISAILFFLIDILVIAMKIIKF